jgi:biotin operon repressor
MIVARIKSKPVIARSLLSNQEQAFPSAKDAAMALGMSRAAISKSISMAKPAKGYFFRFG